MEENSFKKYIIYAIGEVMLVVVGIIIALQLDDWNQSRIDKIEEVKILKAMKTDFIESKERIEETLVRQTIVMNYSTSLLNIYKDKTLKYTVDTIGYYIRYGALSFWRAEPVTGTYDALIGAGNAGLIQNQELRRKLAEFSAEIKFGFEDNINSMSLITILTEKSSNLLSKFTITSSNNDIKVLSFYDSQNETIKAVNKLLSDKSYAGLLLWKTILESNRINWQKELLAYTEGILEIIEKELKKS